VRMFKFTLDQGTRHEGTVHMTLEEDVDQAYDRVVVP